MGASKDGLRTGRRHQLQIVRLGGQRCYELPGPHFDFDKSFVRPDGLAPLAQAASALDADSARKGMIFGHTDTTGPEDYNKLLSERRARSVFAILTHDVALFEKIRAQEGWGLHVTQLMLNAVRDPGTAPINEDGHNTPETIAAVKAFQGAHPPLAVDGDAGPHTRKELFTAYSKKVSEEPIDPTRFRDFGGERIMGCGEYNPFVGNETKDEKSRRVVVIVFDPAGEPPALPCKIGSIAACKPNLMKPGEKSPCPKNDHFRCRIFAQIAARCPQGPPTQKADGSWEVLDVDPADSEPGSGPSGAWVMDEVEPSDSEPGSGPSGAWVTDEVSPSESEAGGGPSAAWDTIPVRAVVDGELEGASYAGWVVPSDEPPPDPGPPSSEPPPAFDPNSDPELYAPTKEGGYLGPKTSSP